MSEIEALKQRCLCARCAYCSPSPLEPTTFFCWIEESLDTYAPVEICAGFKRREAGRA